MLILYLFNGLCRVGNNSVTRSKGIQELDSLAPLIVNDQSYVVHTYESKL